MMNWTILYYLKSTDEAHVALKNSLLENFSDSEFQECASGKEILSQLEEKAAEVIKNKSFKVTVHLHQGKAECSVLTTDLSIDYVKINASYRS